MDQPPPADASFAGPRLLGLRVPGVIVDVVVLLALSALGLVGMGVGMILGLLAGFTLAGLRAREGGIWLRVFLAWLGLTLALTVIVLLTPIPKEQSSDEPVFALILKGAFLSVVVLGIPAVLGACLAWLIRRSRTARP